MGTQGFSAAKANPAGVVLVVQDLGPNKDSFFEKISQMFACESAELARMKASPQLILRFQVSKEGYIEAARRLSATGANVMVFQEALARQGARFELATTESTFFAEYSPVPPRAAASAHAPPQRKAPSSQRKTFRGRRRF